MQGNYGSRFLNQWKTGQRDQDGEDVGIKNAMEVWAKKLGGFADMPDAIKIVLDYLPSDPPSLPEFVNLCRDAGRRLSENIKRVEYQPTDEEKKRAAESVQSIRKVVSRDRRDHRAWAKKLQERRQSGEILANQAMDYEKFICVDAKADRNG